MAYRKKKYDLTNEKDCEELRNLLLLEESEGSDYERDEIEHEESDTDASVSAEERGEDSETDQSDVSETEEDEDEGDESHFVAVQKKNKKIVNEWKWKKTPMSQRKRAPRQNIIIHLPGVIGEARKPGGIYETWNLLINDNILQKITQYTNQYIVLIQTKFARLRDAQKTDITEIKAFIGLVYLAGVYHANRLNLKELWSTEGIERFRRTMSLKRFHFIMRSIRFDDRETREERKHVDRLAPIRGIFEEFVKNCKKSYSLSENITIDEKLEAFRGRCQFRQYIPSKPSKYGIKIFALVDSKLFYTYNMEIYAGQQPDGPYKLSNKPVDVVKRLVVPIHNSGRNVTIDNWFTSYDLVDYLTQKRLSIVGTLKKNKPQIPFEFKKIKDRAVASSIFGFQKDCTLVSYVPKQNKNVILLSSMHFGNTIDKNTGKKQKPEIITYYNATKGGVDTVDKMCASYNVARNTKRWPMVTFYSMLNVCGINSQIIFLGNNNKVSSRRS
nr:piggyBac transposable element-derived protein 4-like [Onthophagus taurus]